MTFPVSSARRPYYDVLKGVLIFLVVFAHGIQFSGGADAAAGQTFYDDPLFQAIYAFHMPLFVAISGYFTYRAQDTATMRGKVGRRFRQLIVPVLAWRTLEYAYRALFLGITLPAEEYLLGYAEAYWFLTVLFLLSVLAYANRKWADDSVMTVVAGYFLLFLVPMNYGLYCKLAFLYPFFFGAYFLRRYERQVLPVLRRYRWGLMLLGIVAYVLLLPHYDRTTFIYNSGFSLTVPKLGFLLQLFTDLLRTAIGAAGGMAVALLIHALLRWMPKWEKVHRLVAFVGRMSLSIYLLQSVLYNALLPWFNLHGKADYGWNLLVAVMLFLVCVGVTLLLRRSRWTRRILLGEWERR